MWYFTRILQKARETCLQNRIVKKCVESLKLRSKSMKNLKGFLAFILTVFFMPVVAQSTQQKIYECYVFNDIAT